jgi:hypothetical protein
MNKTKEKINRTKTKIRRLNHAIAHLETVELEIINLKKAVIEDIMLEVERLCNIKNGG